MSLELSLPSAPVRLTPGVPTRVPVEVRNLGGAAAAVYVDVARGRAAGWAHQVSEPVTVDGYQTLEAGVVLEAPVDQPLSKALVPFTVQAVEAATGEPAGFATGLITIALPAPVTGELAAREGQPHMYDLRLTNDSDQTAAVRVEVKLDPPAGGVTAEPAAVMIEPGAGQAVVIRAKPNRPFLGQPKPYFVLVSVTDAYEPDNPPLLSPTASGKRPPRVAGWMATTVAVLLALGATAGVYLSGVKLPLPGQRKAAPAAATPAAIAPVPVKPPYALVAVFPHTGPDGGKAAAEAAAAQLAGRGLTVRMVDSLASDVLADNGAGFWVLIQDGFADVAAANAFCTQWRAVAPKCTVGT